MFASCGQVDPVRDAFEQVRSGYVREVDSSLLIEAAIKGMESAADRKASSLTAKQTADVTPPARRLSRSCGEADVIRDAFERLRARGHDSAELVEAAIHGMVGILDRHTSYMSPKVFAENLLQTRGEFGAVGLEITNDRGTVKVVTPIEGSPSVLAGIRPGDTITEIDGQTLEGLPLNQVTRMLRGPIGSEISLRLVRSGESQPLMLTLTRAVVRVESVKYERKGDVGYIRVSSFAERTDTNIQRTISALKRQIGVKLKGYVLDLRNNPGGLLDQGIAVADVFSQEAKLYRHGGVLVRITTSIEQGEVMRQVESRLSS